jgi:hypothetical protein
MNLLFWHAKVAVIVWGAALTDRENIVPMPLMLSAGGPRRRRAQEVTFS